MKVIILTPEMQIGGTCRDAIEWGNRLQAQGHEVVLVAQNSAGCGARRLVQGIRLIGMGGGRALFSAWPLLRIFRNDADAVILANAGTLAGWAVIFKALGLIRQRIVYVDSFNPADTFRRGCKTAWIYRRLLWKADAFIHLSAFAERYHRKLGLRAGRSHMVPNISSRSRFARVSPLGPELRFVAVGRLDVIKGFDRLIKAFTKVVARWSGATLRIVGEGYDRPRLEAIIRQARLGSSVTLVGHSDDVAAELRQADLFVLPSVYEGMPNALIEALDQGLRVMATPCKGTAKSLMEALGADEMIISDDRFDDDLLRAAAAAVRLADADWTAIHDRHRALFDSERNFAKLVHILECP